MKIHALTVCVGYAAELAATLPHWLPGLESLTIVSSPTDRQTEALLAWSPRGVHLVQTAAFYADGAAFNKGRAMQYALDVMEANGRWRDWILFFDADILPPDGWHGDVFPPFPKPGREWLPIPGKLYGARRWQLLADGTESPRPLGDREFPGYFQLFHSSDPRAQDRPLLDTTFIHGGNYDSVFQDRWGTGGEGPLKVRLPLHLVHLGTPGNWWGRTPDGPARMQAMYRERARRGGAWDHERINPHGGA